MVALHSGVFVPRPFIPTGDAVNEACENWEISFWGKNITDEDYPANAFVIGVFNQYLVAKGAGRTIGANVKFNF